MLLLALMVGLGLAGAPADPTSPAPVVLAEAMPEPLHAALMSKVDAMSTAEKGIFNEDVSSLVMSYFPKGQSVEETRRTVASRGLGELQPFMGKMSEQDGIMYVTRFSLMSQTFSHVYVVVDFTYRKNASGQPELERTQAFLRAATM